MTEYLFDLHDDAAPDQNAATEAGVPRHWPSGCDWTGHLAGCFAGDDFQQLMQFVDAQRESETVYPAATDLFRAFELTSCANTRVVILGQDPYHRSGQAHGLSFSVSDGVKLPPSLRNIFKELYADLELDAPDFKTHPGDLSDWARQGVLLLNTVLTVREGKPGSHRKKGWEKFSDEVIRTLNDQPQTIVFVLWGNDAIKKQPMITNPVHAVIKSVHPSPLSASRGFIGSRPFSKINQALERAGRESIQWITGG